MNRTSYEEQLQQAYSKLDKIDLLPYLKEYTDALDILSVLEDEHPESVDWLTVDEFYDYLQKRYSDKFRFNYWEEVNFHYDIKEKD